MKILQEVTDLAAQGRLKIAVGQTARLEEAIPLITELEAGKRFRGKAVVVFAPPTMSAI